MKAARGRYSTRYLRMNEMRLAISATFNEILANYSETKPRYWWPGHVLVAHYE